MRRNRTDEELLQELKKYFKKVSVKEAYLKASGDKVFVVKTETIERTAYSRHLALRLAVYHAIARGIIPKTRKTHPPKSR